MHRITTVIIYTSARTASQIYKSILSCEGRVRNGKVSRVFTELSFYHFADPLQWLQVNPQLLHPLHLIRKTKSSSAKSHTEKKPSPHGGSQSGRSLPNLNIANVTSIMLLVIRICSGSFHCEHSRSRSVCCCCLLLGSCPRTATSFTVVAWNADGFITRLDELDAFVATHRHSWDISFIERIVLLAEEEQQ